MSTLTLLIIALVWFGAVILWSRLVPSFVLLLGHGKGAKVATIFLGYLIQVFTYGWVVPLAVGAYRLFRRH